MNQRSRSRRSGPAGGGRLFAFAAGIVLGGGTLGVIGVLVLAVSRVW